jgi:hypothetical protein
MANQCSINNCSYNPCSGNNEKYSTSLSTDKLYDNDQAHSMNCQRPSQMQQYQMDPTTSCIGRYVNTGQIVHPVQNFVTTHAYTTQQPQPGVLMHQKSWDNIPAAKAASMNAHSSKITHHIYPPSLPPKHSSEYQRYVNYDMSNCNNMMPHQYVKEATYTKTTIITTKSTDNLMGNPAGIHYGNLINDNCKCIVQTKQIMSPNCIACANPGYYSNIKKSSSSAKRHVPTKTEITRL